MIAGSCHCGASGWRMDASPDDGLVCNCTLCRRSGGIWAYGHEGQGIDLVAPAEGLQAYVQGDRTLACLRCPHCGNLVAWRGLEAGPDGRRRLAVNLRLADPTTIRHLPLRRFDGLDRWEQLPSEGRILAELLF